ncbi:MAG: hypothetical protein ACREL5_13660 [Gemmatimonadales bacterium]
MQITNLRVLMFGTAPVVLAALGTQAASGQIHREPCEQTFQRATSAATGQELTNAISALTRCPDEFPTFVRTAWTTSSLDSAIFGRLVSVSGTFEDERVFNTLLIVLRDDAQPRWKRLTATSALLTQVCPSRKLGATYIIHGTDSVNSLATFTLEPNGIIQGTHSVQGQPFERFLETLGVVARSSSDLDTRLLARSMIKELSRPGRKEFLGCKP